MPSTSILDLVTTIGRSTAERKAPMSWTRIGVLAGVILGGGAFLAGYLPEHRLRTAAERESQHLREQLGAAEARIRVARLLGEALTVKEVAMRQNYGQAQDLSSPFFNRVRDEAASTPIGELRDVLNDVLSRRDAVTASLTKADPGVVDTLHALELRMRGALGYPLPQASAAD
jgi:hypothetical protein